MALMQFTEGNYWAQVLYTHLAPLKFGAGMGISSNVGAKGVGKMPFTYTNTDFFFHFLHLMELWSVGQNLSVGHLSAEKVDRKK